jgi:hypothetical protein
MAVIVAFFIVLSAIFGSGIRDLVKQDKRDTPPPIEKVQAPSKTANG